MRNPFKHAHSPVHMERIGSREQHEARQRRITRTFTFIVLGLLVLSSLGYAFLSNPSDTTVVENQTGVVEQNGVWYATVYGAQMLFVTDPLEAQKIPYVVNFTLQDIGEKVYVSPELIAPLQSTLGQVVPLQEACLGNCALDLPERNCSSFMIVWNQTGTDAVTQDDQCIIIAGSRAAVDTAVYRLFNLLP